MFYFKGCKKCKGDLHLERDSFGPFLRCLQCGRITEGAYLGTVKKVWPGVPHTAKRVA